MYRRTDVVKVMAWGKQVGAVALDPRSGYYVFEYTRSWVQAGIELAPLQMPLTQRLHIFPLLPEATFKRLPALLADALPDDFGNALIDAYLARQGIEKTAITPLDRLAYMASRGLGALEFQPANSPRTRKPTAVELSTLVEGARSALRGQFDGDPETEAAILNLIQVGTSAGGARAKAVIAWNPDSKSIRSGQLPVEPGFEHWLLKLDGVGSDAELGTGGHYGRIEFAYSLMAKAAGIDMTECRLLEENGRAHFMTKRFDREGDTKHHVQTLCAMAHLDYKQRATHDYAQYLATIRALDLGEAALQEGFRRMVFNVMTANCDDHTKNLSFILLEGTNKWALAPAYDVTHAYNPKGYWTHQHLMGVDGVFKDITSADLMRLADRFQIPDARGIISRVRRAVEQWEAFAAEAGLPITEAEKIHSDFNLALNP